MSKFTFNISLSVLNHLGRNLYRNFITVLGEAISNSWDANANNVWIYIDREKRSLIIKDDGIGMTDDDFQNKFLKIGYSKRKGGNNNIGKRPFIGRKGIGKLALLSCAEKISVVTKTKTSEYIGGTIDNSGLDEAIKDDLTPQEYSLDTVDMNIFSGLMQNHRSGTIIYFENIKEGIRNRIDYIRKLVALYFRFSLIDDNFNIFINDEKVTLRELSELINNTQFLWEINTSNDPYVNDKLLPNENLLKYRKLKRKIDLKGFIASAKTPKNLKIYQTNEKISIDLFVNGRLREKDLLKHIPTARIVENYLYGQIHYNMLDDDIDRFTSSREGVISDDPVFKELLKELSSLLKIVIDEWDKWRIDHKQEGDSENKRLTKRERKSKELFDTISDDYIPPKTSSKRKIVEKWIDELSNDAQFNFASYGECFVSENILRKYIEHNKIKLSPEANDEYEKWSRNEEQNMNRANLSFNLREKGDKLSYLSMDALANLIDKVDPIKESGLSRDAKEYKPIRDALAHTALLTKNAKQKLTLTYENIKARIKKLIGE